jgi:membrane-associated phospholipid phosphatase
MKRWFILALGSSLTATPAAAQSILRNAWSDVKHGALDIGYVWTAPLHTSRRDLEGLGLAVGATGIAFAFDDNLQDWLRAHPNSLPVDAVSWFREGKDGEELGDIWMFIRGSGALWLVGLATGSETLREAASGCAAAGVAQTLPRRLVMYNLVQRTRPRFTDDPYRFDVPGTQTWAQRSFYGGHAANAMTCIAFWNHRFNLGVAEPILYAAALATAVARTVDEAHWTSDTVIGVIAGYAVGKAVAQRQKSRLGGDPAEDAKTHGLQFGYLGNSRMAIGWQIKLQAP